jgi:hypothetical protein
MYVADLTAAPLRWGRYLIDGVEDLALVLMVLIVICSFAIYRQARNNARARATRTDGLDADYRDRA